MGVSPSHDLNPFASERQPVQQIVGALGNAEAQRAVAEVQARMIIARSNPRNAIKCVDDILADCQRPSLAQLAIYQYARGGTDISGPSIRLAEAIARRWGNLATGIKEISRQDGYSECIAYAWDLETGYYDERQFQVRHWRDMRKTDKNPAGGYALTDERDIYELIANMGQRRKRAVLLTILPADVVDAAREQCERTLSASADTSPEALRKMVTAFREFGVSQAQIEKRIQRRMESITPAQVIHLRKIFISIKDQMSKPEDWFEVTVWNELTERSQPEKTEAVSTTVSATVDFSKDAALVATEKTSIEIWASDEFGEPASEGHGFTPVEFAHWFTAKLFLTKAPAALIEHNADALKDAREADPSAESMIVDAIMRHDKRRREDEKNWANASAENKAAAAAKAPKGRTPVKGPTTLPGYLDRAKAEIEVLKDEADIADWITANGPTYKNRATEIPINAAIARRREGLNQPSPDDIFPGDLPLATEGT